MIGLKDINKSVIKVKIPLYFYIGSNNSDIEPTTHDTGELKPKIDCLVFPIFWSFFSVAKHTNTRPYQYGTDTDDYK